MSFDTMFQVEGGQTSYPLLQTNTQRLESRTETMKQTMLIIDQAACLCYVVIGLN